MQNIPTAQLLIGNHIDLIKYAKQKLQEVFCQNYSDQNNSCKICNICRQIQEQQHVGSIWIKPEKLYTRDQIQIIFDTIAFKLEENQKLFFIIQNADFLNDACSNSLLKSIEEPPAGYHFILLAERKNQILPTIQSRCVIKSFYQNNNNSADSDIFNIFSSYTTYLPDVYLKTFEAENITEKDTLEILDKLLGFWLKENKNSFLIGDKEKYNLSNNKINILKNAIEYPPMPGSNKIFWNNLYLQLNLT
ncbi:MAG: polymerase III subunit delta' protein [candidate division TM6 bacterium GW2011_GWF2_30_66]|jgi:DNA polymerase-3 subunit delta'|nr:MAG: polymerase III subunit delta' protein [candidate division TM6 bacterium GW2011_GWF2_30_66]